MSFFSSKNIEQPALSPGAPFKMNFYVERDSLIESKVKKTESDDENINNKRQKTGSDSFIKKNGNIERGSVRKDLASMENVPLGLKSFPSTSFPTSNYKDLENDANRRTQNYADRITKILRCSNTKENSITSFAGNYNKTFINFVKPAKQVETSSKEVKASTDQLFIEKNDCTNHLDRTTQAVIQIVESNDKKVDSANKAFTYNEKQNKTEVKASTDQLFINKNDCANHPGRTTQAVEKIIITLNSANQACIKKEQNVKDVKKLNTREKAQETAKLIQMICEKCKNTKDVNFAHDKCIECNKKIKYQCLGCRKIYKYAIAYRHVESKKCIGIKPTSTCFKYSKCDYVTQEQYLLKDHTGDSHDEVKCRKCNARFKCHSILERHYFFDCKKHKFYSMMKNYCSTCQKPMPPKREGYICLECPSFTRLQCVKCETTCSNNYAYEHIRLCYENIALYCNDCDYKTCVKDELITHIEFKHTQKIYPCSKCSERCDSNAALERHRIVVHNAPRRKIVLPYCPSCVYSLDTVIKEKMACFMCETTLEHQCVFCYSRFPDYDTGYKHAKLCCKDPNSYSCKLIDKKNIFSAEIDIRRKDLDGHNSVTEMIEKENVLNTYTMEADAPNVQHYDVQNHQNVHIETKTAHNVQSQNVKSKQRVQIEHINMPNLQQYNVQNYGNVDIEKENAVQNSDVQIGASNSYENNFNAIKKNSNNSLLLNFPYTNTDDLENLQIEDVNIPNIEQYYPQIQGNFDINKENVQNHDVQIGASNSYENHFNAIRNNSDNSLLLNSSIITTENSERSVNETSPLCLSCGLKSDDDPRLLAYHRSFGCLKTQSQTPINATKPIIIVHCFNCKLSYQHFNGLSRKWCSRCTDGEVRFICGSCRLMHPSFTFIKDHTEQRDCLRYVALQFPYPQFSSQQQFHPVNFNAPISYPHMYPTNYATY